MTLKVLPNFPLTLPNWKSARTRTRIPKLGTSCLLSAVLHMAGLATRLSLVCGKPSSVLKMPNSCDKFSLYISNLPLSKQQPTWEQTCPQMAAFRIVTNLNIYTRCTSYSWIYPSWSKQANKVKLLFMFFLAQVLIMEFRADGIVCKW